ncbi:MAG: hypothetical protein ACRC41_05110 [Sarcina sp.]
MVGLLGTILIVSLICIIISIVSLLTAKGFKKINMIFCHVGIVLQLIAMGVMSFISSTLPYKDVTYSMMDIHETVGWIALVLLILYAIVLSIFKRKGQVISSKVKVISIILFILYLICYGIAMYIGILAAI